MVIPKAAHCMSQRFNVKYNKWQLIGSKSSSRYLILCWSSTIEQTQSMMTIREKKNQDFSFIIEKVARVNFVSIQGEMDHCNIIQIFHMNYKSEDIAPTSSSSLFHPKCQQFLGAYHGWPSILNTFAAWSYSLKWRWYILLEVQLKVPLDKMGEMVWKRNWSWKI